jgi:hypothetical protein
MTRSEAFSTVAFSVNFHWNCGPTRDGDGQVFLVGFYGVSILKCSVHLAGCVQHCDGGCCGNWCSNDGKH